ncbi:hypothetical protein GCM10028787_18020 [Brachybacterium horti]
MIRDQVMGRAGTALMARSSHQAGPGCDGSHASDPLCRATSGWDARHDPDPRDAAPPRVRRAPDQQWPPTWDVGRVSRFVTGRQEGYAGGVRQGGALQWARES